MGITPGRGRGQILIVFAITVTSILAAVGLLYTFGAVLTQRRALQAAADAASLRGSWQMLQELATDDLRDAQVMQQVVSFAIANGLPNDASPSDTTYLTAFYVDAVGALLTPSVQVGSLAAGKFPFNARGVQITVANQVSTVLPNFLSGWRVMALRDSATATARPTTQTLAGPVLPIAVSTTDALAAFSHHTTFDLFALNASRTLDLTTTKGPGSTPNPALSYGSAAVNAQVWSDGAHMGSWQMVSPGSVDLADAAYHAEMAAGLTTNISRQNLNDASAGADKAYGLVIVPLYDTATSTTLHVAGFAQMKLAHRDQISASKALGTFVPYALAAWAPYASPPATDFGAALVSIVS